MTNLKKDILTILQDLKGSGKFATVGSVPFVLPGLSVDNGEELSFPLTEHEIKNLIDFAIQAPFGKGSDTIVDTSVRNTWEIDGSHLTFNNPQWENNLQQVLATAQEDLGLTGYKITANLYKLLVYETGGFFLPHKDSEKEKGMFGSLVINLPAKFTGGELVVSFDKETVVADFAKNSPYEMGFSAFYADCEHEVKEVTSGYRVCLVYNLIQQGNLPKISWSSVQQHANRLADILQNHINEQPFIILLGHQYTPENFSYQNLKLNDRLKAEVVVETAKKLGCYHKLCLVTAYQVGEPKFDNNSYYPEPTDVMQEVFDEELYIQHWLNNEYPKLDSLAFTESDLIVSYQLDEDEPIIKESEGYMGNYGPDLMYWYHYGAIVLWSPTVNADLFTQQKTINQLAWINYFQHNNPSQAEIEAVNQNITAELFETKKYFNNSNDYSAVVDWVIQQNQLDLIVNLSDEFSKEFVSHVDTTSLIDFLTALEENQRNQWITKITKKADIKVVEVLISLFANLAYDKQWQDFVNYWVQQLPYMITNCYKKEKVAMAIKIVKRLLILENALDLSDSWSLSMAKALTTNVKRRDMHLLVSDLLLKNTKNSPLSNELYLLAIDYLQKLVDNKPIKPTNWKKEFPELTWKNKQLMILKNFLQSPTEQVFDYKKVMADRTDLENAIRNTENIELDMETIRKGSPHTLRITKNHRHYENLLKEWKKDKNLLEKMIL